MRIIYGAGAGILLLTLALVYRSTRCVRLMDWGAEGVVCVRLYMCIFVLGFWSLATWSACV